MEQLEGGGRGLGFFLFRSGRLQLFLLGLNNVTRVRELLFQIVLLGLTLAEFLGARNLQLRQFVFEGLRLADFQGEQSFGLSRTPTFEFGHPGLEFGNRPIVRPVHAAVGMQESGPGKVFQGLSLQTGQDNGHVVHVIGRTFGRRQMPLLLLAIFGKVRIVIVGGVRHAGLVPVEGQDVNGAFLE